jgi:hypothetical protein
MQAAFLKRRTTMKHTTTLRMCIEQALWQKSQLHALLIDVAKAYPTVPWDGMCKASSASADRDRSLS